MSLQKIYGFEDIEKLCLSLSKFLKLNTHENIDDSKIAKLYSCKKYKTFVLCGLCCFHFSFGL